MSRRSATSSYDACRGRPGPGEAVPRHDGGDLPRSQTPGGLQRHVLPDGSDLGGLAAARRLLHTPTVSDGFTALWERGRLDLSVEALVLQERFRNLFTEQELERARERLAEYGYRPRSTDG